MKKIIITVIVVLLVGVGAYFTIKFLGKSEPVTPEPTPVVPTPVTPPVVEEKTETVIGKSVEARDIVAYHFGKGDTEVLFVGGIHGGYEWNTSLVAFETMDYLKENPSVIPENVKVTVIPVMNPDGLNKTIGTAGRFEAADVTKTLAETIPGRFNAHNVDLNRNFDCDWQATGKWQTRNVSGGTEAFSEPESQAIKAYVEANDPAAVVVWYSSAGGVFASSCHNGILAETRELTKAFAKASGYKAYEEFNFYEITGDMVNWLAKQNIPAISVLLTDHKSTEWTKNRAGIEAVLKHFGEKAVETGADAETGAAEAN